MRLKSINRLYLSVKNDKGQRREHVDFEAAKMLGVGLAVGFGMIGPGLGLGLIGFSALQGVARNPDAKGPLLTYMILAAGLTEAVAIYVLIMAIILALVV
jgi:F-type H+-transporting ATPase subunit c